MVESLYQNLTLQIIFKKEIIKEYSVKFAYLQTQSISKLRLIMKLDKVIDR